MNFFLGGGIEVNKLGNKKEGKKDLEVHSRGKM